MLHYFVAALISGSSNVSTANFSPRNNKANVHYWIPKELPGTVNWKKKADLLTRLTGTFIQQKCLHRGTVVPILRVFFPLFQCPNLSHMDYHPFPHGCYDTLQNDRCRELSPRFIVSFPPSLSDKHTLLVPISVHFYGHVISCVGCIWI